jgi:hypothetical protein
LVEFARSSRIDLLIVSLPSTAENRVLELLKKLWVLPADIKLSAHNNKLRSGPHTYSYIGNVPFIDLADMRLTRLVANACIWQRYRPFVTGRR